ncbi:MAG: HAD family hydrolase [Candidatus Methylomirabilis oxyfera]|nr:HAD family hydrolase [Candidatus Methylomirabilis oxyfera]
MSVATIRGALFDLDGVVVAQCLDFMAIKHEIFGSTEGFILERIQGLSGQERARAEAILARHETEAAIRCQPLDGVVPLLRRLDHHGLRLGLVTRNSRKSVDLIQARLALPFSAIVTREDAPPKPAPDPILLACRRLGVAAHEVLFVGDFEFDMLAGRRAGVRTVLLRNPVQPFSHNADHLIASLNEIPPLLGLSDRMGSA